MNTKNQIPGEPSPIDANKLEVMAKARPDAMFLKGSGVLKLIGAIRQLEGELCAAREAGAALSCQHEVADTGWKREADDLDSVLRMIGLMPDDYRTDGGNLMLERVRQALISKSMGFNPAEPAQIDLYTGQVAQEPAQCWSVDNEEFCYDTLGELIDNSDDLVVGDIVYAADAVIPDPATYIDVDDILTQIGERATDDSGEYAEDYPDVDDDAKQSLEAFLKVWARKHCTPTNFYCVQNVREHVLTAEDLEKS